MSGETKHKREKTFTLVMSGTRLSTNNQHTIWRHIGHEFVCRVCGKKFKTNKASTYTRSLCFASLTIGGAFANSPCGARTII